MRELKDLSEESRKAIISLAAEFKFAKDLADHLKKLKEDSVHVSQKIREAHLMLRVYRWLARAERKTARREGEIEKLLEEIWKILPESMQRMVGTINKQLKVADATLKKFASSYTGKIRAEIKTIEEEEKLLSSLEKKGKCEPAALALKQRLAAEINDLEQNLAAILKWIGTNTLLVETVGRLATKLEKAGR